MFVPKYGIEYGPAARNASFALCQKSDHWCTLSCSLMFSFIPPPLSLLLFSWYFTHIRLSLKYCHWSFTVDSYPENWAQRETDDVLNNRSIRNVIGRCQVELQLTISHSLNAIDMSRTCSLVTTYQRYDAILSWELKAEKEKLNPQLTCGKEMRQFKESL